HRLDLLSLNYIFMPWISGTFRQDYLENDDPRYALLRNSYENLFIMRTGYSFVYNSVANRTHNGIYQTNGFQLRVAAEVAGNLLYGLSSLLHAQRDKNGQYSLFNIAYSQYAKFDVDYAKSFLINDRNSLALHLAGGIAVPYGNSDIVPYEKRYFAGGANSVRGWGVRELGPGSYQEKDGKINFINQTGNIKLDMSLEYRTQLFWKLHGAAFIDAGNIWNTREYAEQAGGLFRFNKFYKQIAVSYGLGIRLNLDYFILRFDGGMKAINPSVESGSGHYPLLHPDFHRDFTFHFAVGLPF
ncbi:MAG: BamA/TamA family outer membrane protein, partial [Bacteroidaceae bacterium]|nr:BamA/TamA family outer membrane protein [Bacteroidaceae bacterium]